MMFRNIFEYLELSAKRHPDKVALNDDKHSVTFSEWLAMAHSIGTAIATSCAGKTRRPVIVFVDRRIEPLVAFMGVVASGNFYVPVDCKMPAVRLRLMIETLDPVAAVAISDSDERLLDEAGFNAKCFRYDEFDPGQVDRALLDRIQSGMIDLDPVYAIFTSGSTGVPKGVVMSHRGMIDFTQWLCDTFHFNENDSLGNQAPFYFDGSLKDICACLKEGVTLHIIPKKCFSFPKHLITFLNEHRITMLLWATSAVTLVANSGVFELFVPQYLRCLAFGGEAMPAKQLNMWIKAMPGLRVVNLYGPTEAAVDATFYEVDRSFDDDEVLPIGFPCENKGILVLTDDNREAGVNELGELCIRGTGVALGYYNNVAKTREVFVQNPLHDLYDDKIYRTGDIVKYNERGELVFVSRKDFQIKHMGNRIELGEIEAAVNGLQGVAEAACIYDTSNEKIVLFYTTSSGEPIDVVNLVKDKIPKYMYPNVCNCLRRMPHNANGKIDRIALGTM